MEEALKLDFDWLLISDDDAYSQEDAFEILNKKLYQLMKMIKYV